MYKIKRTTSSSLLLEIQEQLVLTNESLIAPARRSSQFTKLCLGLSSFQLGATFRPGLKESPFKTSSEGIRSGPGAAFHPPRPCWCKVDIFERREGRIGASSPSRPRLHPMGEFREQKTNSKRACELTASSELSYLTQTLCFGYKSFPTLSF